MNSSAAAKFDAVFFDLDGTLVDSVEDIAGAVNHARGAMGLKALPVETVCGYVGDGVRMLLQRALGSEDEALLDRAHILWRDWYETHCLDKTRLYPDIQKLLQTLVDRRIPLAVVTNKPSAPSEKILVGLGVRPFFQIVVGGDTVTRRKPDPEPILHAVRQMGLGGGRILMVGDSPNDILGAKNAGHASCGVLWGIGTADAVLDAKPDHVIRQPLELIQIIAIS